MHFFVSKMDHPYDGLLHFLKATSKDQVLQCVSACVRSMTHQNKLQLDMIIQLDDRQQMNELDASLQSFIRHVIYHDCSDGASLKSLFSKRFDKKLGDLLCKIVMNQMPKWKKDMIENQVSMPKLISYEYSVETETASLKPSYCKLSLQTSKSGDEKTHVMLDKETLTTMIDSLAKIRDQISSVVE